MLTTDSPPQTLTKKLVAVVNEKIEIGTAMNAVAHMALGMGASLGAAATLLCHYTDADGISHPGISAYPFIILKGRPTKISEAIDAAKNSDIQVIDFVNTMTVGTYMDQLTRTQATPNAELEFYGAVFYGEIAAVNEITRKFSLFK